MFRFEDLAALTPPPHSHRCYFQQHLVPAAVTLEILEANIREVEASRDIDEEAKTKRVELCGKALNNLQMARSNAEAPICVHEIDNDGRLLTMNAAGLDLAGVRSEVEIRGRS